MAMLKNIYFFECFRILLSLLVSPRPTINSFVADTNLNNQKWYFAIFACFVSILIAVPELYYAYKIGYADADIEYVYLVIGTLVGLAMFPIFSWLLRKCASYFKLSLNKEEASSSIALSYGLAFWIGLFSMVIVIFLTVLNGSNPIFYEDVSLYIYLLFSFISIFWIALILNAVTGKSLGRCSVVAIVYIFVSSIILIFILALFAMPVLILGEN